MPPLPSLINGLYQITAITLALIALALLLYALLWDRPRGRARCPKCWYDLSAARPTPITCPECGKRLTKPRHLHKTRRRYRTAALALFLLLAAAVIHLIPSINRGTWPRKLPDDVLIIVATLPLTPTSWETPLLDEIDRRMSIHGALSPRQWRLLMRRIESPAFPRILASTIRRAARAGTPPEDVFTTLVEPITYDFLFTRDRWPITVPLHARIDAPAWASYPGRVLEVRPRLPDAVITRIEADAAPTVHPLGRLQPDTPPVVDLIVYHTLPDAGRHVLWRASRTIPLTTVDTIDQAITPVRDPHLSDLIVSHLSFNPAHPASVSLRHPSDADPSLRDLALAARIELIAADATPLASLDVLLAHNRANSIWKPLATSNPARLRAALADPSPRPTITVTPLPDLAVTALDADRYWRGPPITIRLPSPSH